MRSTLTRVLAGTAITATALLTVAGTASATAKAPTTLSIATSKSVIVEGQPVTVSGVLDSGTTPVAGKPVVLERLYHKKWATVGARNTDKNGAVSFVRVPPVGIVAFKLVYFGNAKFARSHSALATVVVKPFVKIPTVLSIAESKSTIKAGDTDMISGTLTAKATALVGRWVWLLRYNATKKVWVPVKPQRTGSAGGVSFVVAPAVTAKYELKFFGTGVYAPTHSGVVTVTVTH
jgi:hypothetical protein